MEEPRDHGVDDEHQQHEAEAEEAVAKGLGDVFPAEPLVAHAVFIQLARLHQPVIPAAAFVEHFLLRHPTREDDGIHREFLNAEMRVEEMDGEDEAGRQQRLVGMEDERDVDRPARQEAREEFREPHDQPGEADDGHAPEHGEVIKLLPIRPAVELRFRAFAEEPFVVVHQIMPVLQRGHHRVRTEQHTEEPLHLKLAVLRIADLAPALPRAADDGTQVQREIQERDDGAKAVEHPRRFRSANEGEDELRPVGVVELQRHAGDNQREEAGDDEEMQEAFKRLEAREPFIALLRLDLGLTEGF